MYQLRQIPSEAQIRKFFRRIIFGKNVFCPRCRSRQIFKYENRYRCKRCRLPFSLLSHTWLASMKLSYQKFWMVLWCWTTQIPIKQARALTELSEEAVRRWYDNFRKHLPFEVEVLERVVQLDEAFFGGRQGCALMMAKQKGARRLAYQMIGDGKVQRQHVKLFLETYIKPRSKLCTDGASYYQGIHQWWPIRHTRELHSKWEFEITSEIEGTFGNLRIFIRRMYHHVSLEKLPEVVGEFCYRFSHPEIFNNPHHYLRNSLKLVPFD